MKLGGRTGDGARDHFSVVLTKKAGGPSLVIQCYTMLLSIECAILEDPGRCDVKQRSRKCTTAQMSEN